MFKRLLCASTVLASLAAPLTPSRAAESEVGIRNAPVPPMPDATEIERALKTLGRGTNSPITGASRSGRVTGGAPLPSLEALQALRASDLPAEGAEGLKAQAVCQEGKRLGASGGLAGRSSAIVELLRRYEDQLDIAFDFEPLMLPASGRIRMRPPVVTEAQLSVALSDDGQAARETGRIYQITRRATLSAGKPNWRAYLVPNVAAPTMSPESLRPRTDKEAEAWDRCVAEGWADGERMAVENFRDGLGNLERDMIGMGRFLVLLRAGLVEPPRVAMRHIRVQGGGNDMRLNDTQLNITGGARLNSNQGRWRDTPQIAPGGPIGTVTR